MLWKTFLIFCTVFTSASAVITATNELSKSAFEDATGFQSVNTISLFARDKHGHHTTTHPQAHINSHKDKDGRLPETVTTTVRENADFVLTTIFVFSPTSTSTKSTELTGFSPSTTSTSPKLVTSITSTLIISTTSTTSTPLTTTNMAITLAPNKPVGAIVGSVLGGIAALLLLSAGSIIIYRRSYRKYSRWGTLSGTETGLGAHDRRSSVSQPLSTIGIPVGATSQNKNFTQRLESLGVTLGNARRDPRSISPFLGTLPGVRNGASTTPSQLDAIAPGRMQPHSDRPALSKSVQRRQELVQKLQEMKDTVSELEKRERGASSIAQASSAADEDEESINAGWRSEREIFRRQVERLQDQMMQLQAQIPNDEWEQPPPSYVSDSRA